MEQAMDLPERGKAHSPSRRSLLAMIAAAGLVIGGMLAGSVALAASVLAQGGDVAVDQLMAGEALPDVPLGASDAPITIIEYASMTCSHCAAFSAITFPE